MGPLICRLIHPFIDVDVITSSLPHLQVFNVMGAGSLLLFCICLDDCEGGLSRYLTNIVENIRAEVFGHMVEWVIVYCKTVWCAFVGE